MSDKIVLKAKFGARIQGTFYKYETKPFVEGTFKVQVEKTELNFLYLKLFTCYKRLDL